MILVEPTHVFLDEMIGNRASIPGLSNVTISVVTLFSLASEIHAKHFRHIYGGNVRSVDRCITEVEHTQICFLFGSSINFYSMMSLLLPLTAGGIVLFCIRCCRVALASVMLFGSGSGVGNGTRCTI
jgi:hypothetical protein